MALSQNEGNKSDSQLAITKREDKYVLVGINTKRGLKEIHSGKTQIKI